MRRFRVAAPDEAAEKDLLLFFEDYDAVQDVWGWRDADFLRHAEGSAVSRIGFVRWQRNLAVALGNAPAQHAALAP